MNLIPPEEWLALHHNESRPATPRRRTRAARPRHHNQHRNHLNIQPGRTLDMSTTPTIAVATAAAAAAPSTPRPIIEASRLVKTYGHGDSAVRALNGADLTIDQGQFTAIMGPSGSGKSTMMHAMAGLDSVDSGTIRLGDTDITSLNEKQRTLLRRERIGFVFQSFNLVPSLTAAENIALPLTLAGKKVNGSWLNELSGVLGIGHRLTHRPGELSGGQQQRVAVARALIARPDVVFADEPTGNLDSRHGAALLAFLKAAAHDFGQTIVMVTHDPVAASYADRVSFLADGQVHGHLYGPTVPAILDRMATLEPAPAAEGR
jgi:putative ABC transport system ATP-binding protein